MARRINGEKSAPANGSNNAIVVRQAELVTTAAGDIARIAD